MTPARADGAGLRGIINVSSVAGFEQAPTSVSYNATKAWMTSFTNGLAIELTVEHAPDVVRLGHDEGVLLNATGPTTIRLAPPLTLTEAEAKEGLAKLRRALDRLDVPELTQPGAS